MNVNIVVALINITAIIAFVVLAIVFGKWWLSLFGLLFLHSVESKEVKRNE